VEGYQIAEIIQSIVIVVGVALLAYSPIARSIGDRIRHGKLPRPGALVVDPRMEDLSGEVAAMRQQLAETQERLDFAERLLAQARNKAALGEGA
jgi:hypothetical protein